MKRYDKMLIDVLNSDALAAIAAILRRFKITSNEEERREDIRPLLQWAQLMLPEHFTLPPSSMHVWLANELDRATRRRGTKINLLAPRGSAKSTLGTLAYPLRQALENREHYIWIVSDTKSQALSHLNNIAYELKCNARLKKEYAGRCGDENVKFSGNRLTIRNNVVIESYGTGQRIRGRKYKEFRPSLIICDDLQNEDHIVSANLRSRSRQWFYGTLMKAGNGETNFVHLATALHQEAIAMELTQNAGWISKVFKAIMKFPLRSELWEEWRSIACNISSGNAITNARRFYLAKEKEMTEGSEVLWRENESLYDLMRQRLENGEQAFLREKQNSPINPDLCEFSESYFKDGIWCDAIPNDFAFRAVALDPSKGVESRYGDYSAFVIVTKAKDGRFFVEADLEKRSITDVVEKSIELLERYEPDLFGIEVNQFQELIKIELERRLAERGILIRPYPIVNRKSKSFRIRRLEPYLSMRKFRFLDGNRSTRLLVEQLKQFPIGDHDDGPDALEMATRLIEMSESEPLRDGFSTERLNIDIP